jgi:hypothetical protein|tara:strand:+ start:96 stop:305 length:210 start_codon:yes stop_codon:yes gene_type:complete
MMSSDGTNIVRVSDEEASKLYHNENFKYIAKSVWKEKVRDIEQPQEEPTNKKTNKMSKAQKRHLRKSNK